MNVSFNDSFNVFNQSSSAYNFEYLLPTGPFPDIQALIQPFNDITDLIVVMDIVWRVYRSCHLFFRYWFQSAVGLPVVDITKFKATKKPPKSVQMANCVTSPVTIFAIIFFLGVGIAFAAAEFLVPLFATYQQCFDPNQENIFAQDSYAIAFNYISSDGNTMIQKNAKLHDGQRSTICGEEVKATSELAQTLNAQMLKIQTDYAQISADFRLVDKCLNLQDVLTSGGMDPSAVNAWLTHPQTLGCKDPNLIATEEILNPVPSIFNCSDDTVPFCIFDDIAPDESDTLSAATQESACHSQKFILMQTMEITMAVVVFICWNIARMLVMMGLSRIYWRRLTPRGFNYAGSCTRQGEILGSTRKELLVALSESVRKFEVMGYILLFLGVVLPWPPIIILSAVDEAYFKSNTFAEHSFSEGQ